MKLTLNIDDSKYEEFKEAFLSVYPAPVDSDTGEQLIADNVWIRKRIVGWLRNTYRKGKSKIYRRQQSILGEPTFIS